MSSPYETPFHVDDLPAYIVDAMAAQDRVSVADAPAGGITTEALIDLSRRWKNGATLTVAFLGGDPNLHDALEGCLREIESACGLRFKTRTASGAVRTWSRDGSGSRSHIRVSFDLPGYFSLIGTDSVNPGVSGPGELVGGRKHQTSLNLGGFDQALPTAWRRTMLHELLHALGVHHEHANPLGPCQSAFRWDDDPGYVPTTGPGGAYVPDAAGRRPGIYTWLSGPPNGWGKAKIDLNLRPPGGPGILPLDFDNRSVMLYRFDPLFYATADSPCLPVGQADTLSDGDRRALATLYPPPA